MKERSFLIRSIFLAICLLMTSLTIAAPKLSADQARRLIARVAGFALKNDDVRIESISMFGSSAVVEAEIRTAFRFEHREGGWRIAEMRVGPDRWEDVELFARALNAEKRERARAELETIAAALRAFRRDHGFYVVADSHAVLIDHLSPRYLSRVIRLDPWHRDYLYRGTRDDFELRSAGEDGRAGTEDDIVVSARGN
jgi:hypothetical protein